MEPDVFKPEGFDIPGRELSVEEQTRTVTGDRFMEWMRMVGEDYVDQVSLPKASFLIFIGFLMHKYPSRSAALLKIANDKYGEALTIQHDIYETEEGSTDESTAYFYNDLAEFINLTGALKARTNANLIIVTEHYTH